jgi:Coatomer gamma subunit appendage platform subdomain
VALGQCAELAQTLQGSKHLYSSLPPANLNDASAEYLVQTVKHFFDRCVVVQYAITNTLEEHILSDVKLKVTAFDAQGYGL